MALIDCNFFSEVLGINTTIKVILPERSRNKIGSLGSEKKDKYPVLYLLHGFSDDNTAWTRKTGIERYVEDKGIAVVMPSGDLSYYTDMAHGKKYWTFISEEVPRIVEEFFPISNKRDDNFVAGLSMGGYGSIKLALKKPDKFKAVASFSGAVEIEKALEALPEPVRKGRKVIFDDIFGDYEKVLGSEEDLVHLADNFKEPQNNAPKIYMSCGTEDFFHTMNVEFRDIMIKKGFDVTYDESKGCHSWDYWDECIKKALKWFLEIV